MTNQDRVVIDKELLNSRKLSFFFLVELTLIPLKVLIFLCGKSNPGSWPRMICISQAERNSSLSMMKMSHFRGCSEGSVIQISHWELLRESGSGGGVELECYFLSKAAVKQEDFSILCCFIL